MLERIGRLEYLPLRVPVPKELAVTGESKVRRTQHPLYRIMYEVEREDVTVFLIADGRRDMAARLRDRLLTRSPG